METRRRAPATLPVAAALAALATLAACGSGSVPAPGSPAAGGHPTTTTAPSTRTAPSRPQAARRTAQALLAKVVLPPGARATAGEPAGDGGRLSRPPVAPAALNLVELHRFAVLAGSPAAAIAWERAHVPAGAALDQSGWSGTAGVSDTWFVVFSWPAVRQLLDNREAAVSVTALPGGRTAVRVDALVTWLPAKPAGDLVPAGATVLTAVLSRGLNPGQPGHPLTTVTDRAVIQAIRDRVNGLAVIPPGGATNCPADFGQTLTLVFYAGPGKRSPLATVVADAAGCERVTVTRNGRPAAPALAGAGLPAFVESELGWPVKS